MLIKRPANYGWPYCVTPDLPYVDYDFATKTSGEEFNCNAPTNDSPYNTGLKRLPAVAQPDVWYSYDKSPLFPELGPAGTPGGIAPMGGPAYDPDPATRRCSASRTTSRARRSSTSGRATTSRSSASTAAGWPRSGRSRGLVDNPMDMEYGPDGALYVLEYGDGYFAENPDAQLAKINFVRGNHTPVVKAAATPTAGRSPLTVTFSSAGTNDPDGDPITYAWDFEANGSVDSTAANPTFTYNSNGTYRATLKVTDRTGRSAAAEVLVLVGNAKPVVKLTTTPAPEQPFQFGDTVSYTVEVTDDTEVDCSEGHRGVRARPRDARSPAVLDRGLHGLDHDVRRRRPRRRGEPERRVRRLLHGSGRGRHAWPDRERAGPARPDPGPTPTPTPPAPPLDRGSAHLSGPALQLGRCGRGPGVRERPSAAARARGARRGSANARDRGRAPLRRPRARVGPTIHDGPRRRISRALANASAAASTQGANSGWRTTRWNAPVRPSVSGNAKFPAASVVCSGSSRSPSNEKARTRAPATGASVFAEITWPKSIDVPCSCFSGGAGVRPDPSRRGPSRAATRERPPRGRSRWRGEPGSAPSG